MVLASSRVESGRPSWRGVGLACPRFALGLHQRQESAGDDSFEQIGLPGLERSETAKHVEKIKQVFGIFGEPMVGLDLFERRGRPFVADQNSGKSREFELFGILLRKITIPCYPLSRFSKEYSHEFHTPRRTRGARTADGAELPRHELAEGRVFV
jgi:hypothetical protein